MLPVQALCKHSDLQQPQTSPLQPYLHPWFITLDHYSPAGQRGLSHPGVLLQMSRGYLLPCLGWCSLLPPTPPSRSPQGSSRTGRGV